MEKFSNKRAEQMEDIKKKLLGEGDTREVLLNLFDKLSEDYDLVEKVIVSLKKDERLTDVERDRLRDIDDVYEGALDEWAEMYAPHREK